MLDATGVPLENEGNRVMLDKRTTQVENRTRGRFCGCFASVFPFWLAKCTGNHEKWESQARNVAFSCKE